MKHPDAIEKINFVIDFIMDACDAPIMLYIETAGPALLKAIIRYYELDMIQIFTRYVKPPGLYKGKRGGTHGAGDRKKKPVRTWRRYWRAFSNFDPNNKVADLLPNDGYDSRTGVTPGVRTLWHLYDVQQRFMYWVMVAEISLDFFYDWLSGVANSQYCRDQYRPLVFATSTLDGNLPVLGLTPIVIETIVKARNGGSASGNAASVPGWGSVAIFSATMFDDRGQPASPDQRLAMYHDDGSVIYGSSFSGNGSQSVVTGSNKGEGAWHFFTSGPVSYLISDLEVTVIGAESQINDD